MAYWACAQLVTNREQLALHCLREVAGFEVYSPRLRPARRSKIRVPRPLFPGYAFILIVSGWWSARWSPGVVRLVLDGAVPARVPDNVIMELRSRERDGLIVLPERGPRVGDSVRISRGVFAGRLGLYAGMKGHERVMVLLALLGSQRRIELPKRDIEAI